jgi:hypothetical protein
MELLRKRPELLFGFPGRVGHGESELVEDVAVCVGVQDTEADVKDYEVTYDRQNNLDCFTSVDLSYEVEEYVQDFAEDH